MPTLLIISVFILMCHLSPVGFNSFRMYVQVTGLADYLADTFSIREVLDIVDWRPKAEARIDRLRKADFSIRY